MVLEHRNTCDFLDHSSRLYLVNCNQALSFEHHLYRLWIISADQRCRGVVWEPVEAGEDVVQRESPEVRLRPGSLPLMDATRIILERLNIKAFVKQSYCLVITSLGDKYVVAGIVAAISEKERENSH
jgi:hypothetical protein